MPPPIEGPDNTNGPLSPTSNEALAAVEAESPDNTNSPSSPTSNEALAAVEGEDQLGSPRPADYGPAEYYPFFRNRQTHTVRYGDTDVVYGEIPAWYAERVYRHCIRLLEQVMAIHRVLDSNPSENSIPRIRAWRRCFRELSSLRDLPMVISLQQRNLLPDLGDYSWQIGTIDYRIRALGGIERSHAAMGVLPTALDMLLRRLVRELEENSVMDLQEAVGDMAQDILDSGVSSAFGYQPNLGHLFGWLW